ncbi:hypothetical protein BDV96DRAFT_565272 [Lophiotrema nucula]|uniref:LIM zinc-binding domain-containing protein n=1 Tax=Lophiotrema nucula TaxID=690887 RepID=A0A6A5ZP33_9PLEO|nr:hypothetical protein BDV96DRAFT_565272 [Lophiotrema nucula]
MASNFDRYKALLEGAGGKQVNREGMPDAAAMPKPPKERAASPGPTYMSNAQMASFLNDLRTNRPARPNGSRPPPAQFSTWSSRTSKAFTETPAVSPFTKLEFKDAGVDVDVPPPQAEQPSRPHQRTTSNMSIDEVLAGGGRALVQPPRGRDMSTSSAARDRTPSVTYRENGERQVEREEARALRIAMEELDLQQEEKLYNSARDEAAELVWKHINPNAPENKPNAAYAYPGLSRRGSHNRSRSLGRAEQDLQRTNSKLRRKRNSMGSNASGSRSSSLQSRTVSGSSTKANVTFGTSPPEAAAPINGSSEEITALPKMPSGPVDPKQRRRSSGTRRKISAGLFKNPDDQIYEEPEEETAPPPAVANPPPPAKLPLQVRRNPFSRFQSIRESNLTRANTDPVIGSKRFDRTEIHKNPVTQSRNAAYTSNTPVAKPQEDVKADAENEPDIKMKDGKEIRGDELRAATSFSLRDRSPKLPTPTAVSDTPGRPIVSFKKDWKATKEIELKEEISSLPQSAPRQVDQTPPTPRPLSKSVTAPVVPTIHFPEESPKRSRAPSPSPLPRNNVGPTPPAPSTRVSRAHVPAISVYEDPPARPLPEASSRSRKVNTPPTVAPPVPTINVSQAPSARSKPSPTHSVTPTISVQEAPHISVSPADRSSSVKAPSISITPAIPTIAINEPSTTSRAPKANTPAISAAPSTPSININGPPSSTRPLPNPKNHTSKPLPRANPATANQRSSHFTPTTVRMGALCSHCALPIAGRIVSAAGVRFHPECFLCHHCGEGLECVAFYPEPDNKRAERISRIRARQRGEDIEVPSGVEASVESMQRLEEEDGWDEGLRFYCHLDFHEFFSPRCKSCKTPIEGEVVVACGAEWHVGHFFCAQCGDPFDSKTPFVEKDGYAWCVDCHTNRYSAKCRKCRRPVTDMVVKALGAEWHAGCFVCNECCGPFDDGRYFLRGDSQDPVCVKCEERRLKA